MWINNKNVGSILAPIVFPTLSIEAWNAMQWNGMKWYEESCTLDNKAFTHYSIICVDRRRDDPAYVLFSLLAANIWNALFDVSTRKKLTSAREMCEEMQEIEIETAPEPVSLSHRPSSFLPMKEHWRLIQTNFNETFHNFVSWVDLNILLSFWYFFIWRKKIAFSTKMHFSCLNIFKS